jgi:arabinogalactan endo-1,4-beta-galactosidase
MKPILLLLVGAAAAAAADYAMGADLSFLKQAEDRGTVFQENMSSRVWRSSGITATTGSGCGSSIHPRCFRLRLFHTPTLLPNNLGYAIALAQSAKKHGFKFLLDYHYSDSWADPGKQFIPKAWEGTSHAQMVNALFQYPRDTTAAFLDAGVPPDMVQIGNEITNGMLWPDAKLPQNWDNFADFIKAGIAGVEAGNGNEPRPRIMVHMDKGGSWTATEACFDKLATYHVNFVIGQSYYPWWHGSLNDLRLNLVSTAREYDKDIVVVEAAYNWTPGNYRTRPGPFPETPKGQKEFWEEVNRTVQAAPGGRGIGVFWWEPAVGGGRGGRGFFDKDGNVLPVTTVFDKFTRN